MERAIKDLCQLTEPRMFEEVATGVDHVVEVVERLDSVAHKLSKTGDYHAARILGNLAEEEAAKVLILVDAVRCPRNEVKQKSRTLGYFYGHLAKGIYADVCGWSPADFAEVMRGVEDARVEHYLDGPVGVDWIFPNHVLQTREDDLYVGYVRDDSDEDGEGERYWTPPRNDKLFAYWTPPLVKVACALHQVGATTPKGLAAVAEVWRSVELRPETEIIELQRLNQRTLEVLNERGLLGDSTSEVLTVVWERWPFPLWSLDLSVKKISKDALREVRKQWTPEGW